MKTDVKFVHSKQKHVSYLRGSTNVALSVFSYSSEYHSGRDLKSHRCARASQCGDCGKKTIHKGGKKVRQQTLNVNVFYLEHLREAVFLLVFDHVDSKIHMQVYMETAVTLQQENTYKWILEMHAVIDLLSKGTS